MAADHLTPADINSVMEHNVRAWLGRKRRAWYARELAAYKTRGMDCRCPDPKPYLTPNGRWSVRMCLKCRGLLALLFVLIASSVFAQAPNIASYTVDTYAPGVTPATGSPISSTPYMPANITCNQTAPTVPATVTNPTSFFFDDAAHSGKVCVGSLSSGWLQALPNQTGYTIYASQTDTLGQSSPRSAASNPFGRQGAPNVVTGLRVF